MSLNLFLFLCVILGSVNSAVIHIDQIEIAGHEGECYDESGQIFYKKGEILKNKGGECTEKKCLGCLEEIGKLRIKIITCPAVEAGRGCIIVQDPSKPYPECCPRLMFMPSAQPQFCEPPDQQEK